MEYRDGMNLRVTRTATVLRCRYLHIYIIT